jgi:hypothetical protein
VQLIAIVGTIAAWVASLFALAHWILDHLIEGRDDR